MKLAIRGSNGVTNIEIGRSPASESGVMPTGAPGEAALEILAGFGHGATAGLGGADWQAGCGVFRGENYIIGPSYNQESNDAEACKEAGIGRICSPNAPKGVWLFPARITLDPLSFGTWSLTLPIGGRLFALELCATAIQPVPAPPEPIEVPCSCDDCGGLCSFLAVTNFKSRQINTAYPGLGRETGFTPSSSALVPYDPNLTAIPACYFSRQRLLDGQNFLPPWVPNVDLKNGNDELQWTLTNIHPTLGMSIDMVMHIRYGNFDLKAAVDAYCKSCAA